MKWKGAMIKMKIKKKKKIKQGYKHIKKNRNEFMIKKIKIKKINKTLKKLN